MLVSIQLKLTLSVVAIGIVSLTSLQPVYAQSPAPNRAQKTLPSNLGQPRQRSAAPPSKSDIGANVPDRQNLPENINGALRRILSLHNTDRTAALNELRSPKQQLPLLLDARKERPLVDIYPDGKISLKKAVALLQQRGFTVKATSTYRRGVIEGYIPLERAGEIARLGGLRSVAAAYAPVRNIGAVTSEAVSVQKIQPVQDLGFQGAGVKIGVLSDSYNTSFSTTTAEDDIATGDLPGPGNPDGNTTPVTVLEEFEGGADEGRAILQLVHDIAPKADLGFATAFSGEVEFANNIIRLRNEFGADVIVDDVIYFDEPFFEDGVIAQAVNFVASSGAAYFSSAGNNSRTGLDTNFKPVSRSTVQQLKDQGLTNIDLSQVPSSIAKNFHNFGTGPIPVVTQQVISSGGPIVFQWDEPFNAGLVKTDYNLLIFSTTGDYLGSVSGIDKNLSTDQPLEIVFPFGNFQLAIAKANNGPANRLRYVYLGNGSSFDSTPVLDGPTTYGHAVARGGQAVGAVFFGLPKLPEDFSSRGPSTILFDVAGNRLGTPDLRNVPQIAGVDGVSTTFFSGPPGPSGFPQFFGTSAAAPNVAGVAALVLEAAGGPGSVSPQKLYRTLQATATRLPLDLSRAFSKATFAEGKILAVGGDFEGTFDANFFRLSLKSGAGKNISTVSIDLNPTGTGLNGVVFAPQFGTLVGNYGGSFVPDPNTGIVALDTTTSADNRVLTVTFDANEFQPGSFINFNVNRVFAGENPFFLPGGNADVLQNAIVTVNFSDGSASVTKFKNVFDTTSFNFYTGAGLVNAQKAVDAIQQ